VPKQKRNLPDYDNPPVTEVVIGVQFDRLEKFNALHPGIYWQRVKDNYPVFKAHPPLADKVEVFDSLPPPPKEVMFSQVPPIPRCWFIENEQNRVIQLQAEHFLHNWRKVKGTDTYPRYDKIRKDFKALWTDFLKFVREEKLGEVKANHWEVTYVNHLTKGVEWDSLADLKKIFSYWSGKSSEKYLPEPENLDLNLSYVFPDKQGRLYISLGRAFRASDKTEVLLLKLTARGRLESPDSKTLLRSLDLGREWIVRGFTDFTSNQAHCIWKRKDK